ncbi:hypothetical protein KC909_01090 [Candidatus Dojkabacteria bacterium]|uniref:Uncharacterized protein n=1 Tax=Candidatus Dojkabacteria bacterium TaxID=2099670 RepID=A0A955L599_9BACT|nr:hypothetical protein [Candidatus Dojkabacteria bacterium]
MCLELSQQNLVEFPDELIDEDPFAAEVIWQRPESFAEMKARLLSETAPALINKDTADQYKNRYGNLYGNSINCVVKYLREGGVFTEENFSNRLTASTEKARRKATGELEYTLAAYDQNWEIPVLEAIYNDGIDSHQVPRGEEARNFANRALYERAKATRASGDFDSIILELSPTPEFLTEELIQRGYDGYHVVFGWKFDPVLRREQVNLYWLKKDVDHAQFIELIEQIPATAKRYQEATLPEEYPPTQDVSIMLASGAIPQEAYEATVMTFINENRIPNNSPELAEFIDNVVGKQILAEVLPLIQDASILITEELDQGVDNSNALRFILQQIEDLRAGYEYLTYLKLDELSGVNTVQKNTIVSADEFAELSIAEQIEIMDANDFESSYCGGQRSFGNNGIAGLGETSSASVLASDSADHNLCVRCLLVFGIVSYGPVGKCSVGLECCQGYYDGGIYE